MGTRSALSAVGCHCNVAPYLLPSEARSLQRASVCSEQQLKGIGCQGPRVPCSNLTSELHCGIASAESYYRNKNVREQALGSADREVQGLGQEATRESSGR